MQAALQAANRKFGACSGLDRSDAGKTFGREQWHLLWQSEDGTCCVDGDLQILLASAGQ